MVVDNLVYDLSLFTVVLIGVIILNRLNAVSELDKKSMPLHLLVFVNVLVLSILSALNKYLEVGFAVLLASVSIGATLFSFRKIKSKLDYCLSFLGSLSVLIYLYSQFLPSIKLFMLAKILLMGIGLLIPFLVIILYTELEFIYIPVLFTHFLDASSTIIALDNGLRESMSLARIFIDIFGPAGIYLMKSLIFIPITYYITEGVEENLSFWFLYLISIYGLALAIRNYFLIVISF